jgi:anaerobic nitric oxide reductase transcription regulator
LEHVISRAALKAISRGAQRTDIVTLESALLDLDEPSSTPIMMTTPIAQPNTNVSLRDQVDVCQRLAIRQALANSHDNWAIAARNLATDASNLHKLARRLGIKT